MTLCLIPMSVFECRECVLEISESMNVCLIPMSVFECRECVLDTNVNECT